MGDSPCQWNNPVLDPQGSKTPELINIKLDRGDYLGDIIQHANFGISILRGGATVHAWNNEVVIIRVYFYPLPLLFTALHVMQTRYCDENSGCPSVCPSVRLSVCHTRGLWQNGTKICLDLYTIWKNIQPSFLRRRMVGGGRPLLPAILGQPAPVGTKSPIFNR